MKGKAKMKLTTEQRTLRVKLAQDVIAKIAAKEITPKFGRYILIDKNGCQACALGSMVAACCGIADLNSDANTREMIHCLTPLFDVEELAVIEATFEGDADMPMREAAEDISYCVLEAAAEVFGENPDSKYCAGEGNPGASDRITAIMQNIIKHDGDFVLGDM